MAAMKRPADVESEMDSEVKRRRTEKPHSAEGDPSPEASDPGPSTASEPLAGLLSLDDPCLLRLVTLVPFQDRINLSRVCTRLQNICADASLWTEVDTHFGDPLSLRELRSLLKFVHGRTRRVALRGFLRASVQRQREAVSSSLLEQLRDRCPALAEVSLTECYVDATRLHLGVLPRGLERLALRDSEFVNTPTQESYFRNLELTLPRLRVLDLAGCGWVSNHSLMAICKCEQLEELNLRGCFRIGVCFVYTALACRFGFKRLRKLDLRDTSIGNSEVPAFGRLPEITHLKMGKTSASLEILRPSVCESDGEITDRGLLSLCPGTDDNHVSKLRHLTLTHLPRVTNRVSSRLARGLPALQRLDVRGTKVGPAGAAAIRKLRPSCEVDVAPLPLAPGEAEAPTEVEEAQDRVVILQMIE